MRVLSLAWVGTRATEYAATVAFFRDVLGLGVHSTETDFTVLDVPGGASRHVRRRPPARPVPPGGSDPGACARSRPGRSSMCSW